MSDQPDGQTFRLFVASEGKFIEQYMNSSELAVLTLQFTQRPPDDLIQMIGNLLDANINAVKRKEERIPINQDTMRKLGLPKKEMSVTVQGVPRHCILQDLSFGGAKIVLLGLAQFLINKDVSLQFEFEDPHEIINLKGVIVNASFIEGRKDIIEASIKYDEASVSLAYKIRINNFITTMRKTELNQKFADVVEEVPPADSKPAAQTAQTAPVSQVPQTPAQ